MVPLVVMAMEAEAAPVRAALGLGGGGEQLHHAFPARVWRSDVVALAVNGVLVSYRKGMKTPLADGDVVAFVKAAAGG